MKKALIILSVAILGVVAFFEKGHSGQTGLVSSSSTPVSTSTSTSTPPAAQPAVAYKDGTYTGNAEDTPYGTVQMAAVISGGKIVDVSFIQMPNGNGHTDEVTAVAKPLLKQTTIQAQSSNIDFVSGATTSSEAYQMSLQAALDKAAQG